MTGQTSGELPERDAFGVIGVTPDSVVDGENLDCGSGLLLIIRRAMNQLREGQILEVDSTRLLDPTDDFINAHLDLVVEGERKGQRPVDCPLFNVPIGDRHLSAIGAEVWAASDFTPFAGLVWPDDRAVSLQPHPEFLPAYAVALIETRRDGPLTPEQADRAIKSYEGPDDRARVGGWIKNFLARAGR